MSNPYVGTLVRLEDCEAMRFMTGGTIAPISGEFLVEDFGAYLMAEDCLVYYLSDPADEWGEEYVVNADEFERAVQ